ncbi:uncharacterized protein [Cardiocondyla obscurior]|uniref:uncharacterized protein n=1 Tax=Cardiocondyla obscurior TaxID=286306 RepID=UPI0039657866
MTARAKHATKLKISSRTDSFDEEIDCIVADGITQRILARTINCDAIKLPSNIILADPQFYKASKVHLLIGAELFWNLICVGQIRATQHHPTLQKTRLGWILTDRVMSKSGSGQGVCAMHATITGSELHNRVERFWEINKLAESSCESKEERACERHFVRNVEIDTSGRYVVKLPIDEGTLVSIGQSRDIAHNRFLSLERKFGRNNSFKDAYIKFISEYHELGHIKLVTDREINKSGAVYLPHYGVFKKGDLSGKLRVVFDASCKTSTGILLNDALLKGPMIQQDLVSILMRFCTLAYVFSADIVKMYQQIQLHESQTYLERILWRDSRDAAMLAFQLTTVTYGTTSAPFLVVRCLQHLAQVNANKHPIGARRILRDFYVDDLLTGADTLAEGRRAQDEIIQILNQDKFVLSK